MSARLRTLVVATFAFATWAHPTPALAVEEQWHAGVTGEWALLGHDGTSYPGLGGSLHLTYGLSDTFNLMLEAGASAHDGGNLAVLRGEAGAGYVFDVLSWVPYIGFMVGADDVWTVSCEVDADCTHDLHPSVSVPLGLDYQLNRSFALGVGAEMGLLFFGDDGTGSLFTVGLRAETMWGY
jgi:hypothetical protein